MDEKLKNIFLKDTSKIIGYTSHRAFGGNLRIPSRNRIEHSTKLQRQFEQAWKDAVNTDNDRKVVSLPTKQGIYVEFRSALNHDLVTKSLEDKRIGIKLLNVKKEVSDGKEYTRATVYIPPGKESHFINKFQDYAQKDTPKGHPKHADLVKSIDDLRLAVLESFWQDKKEYIPTSNTPIWCEIWLRGDDDTTENSFKQIAQALNIELQEGTLRFPERTVVLGKANQNQLKELIDASPDIAELRRAAETAHFFMNIENAEQVKWVNDLIDRVSIEQDTKVAICILDTGINNGHPLLKSIIGDSDCQAYDTSWGCEDHNGHGTLMSGLAIYGDLQNILESKEKVQILHRVESVKILPPTDKNDPKLYGYITMQSISRAEIQKPDHTHIICMAVTTDNCTYGRPSSWSAAIDEVTSGSFDNQKRLFIVSAGNTDNKEWHTYPDNNMTNAVQDPGQSWNAITIGAYTNKVLMTEPSLKDYKPLAPTGGLSPFSSTSLIWENNKWPVKPDIVLEGGNVAKDGSDFCTNCDDLSLISTFYKHTERQFDTIWGTSAATAQAAWMASQIQAIYPEAWPETVRALLIHSAEWTDSMKAQFIEKVSKTEFKKLLRICGYGVPSINKALWCANNSVNLVVQDELQPYEKRDGRCRTRDMHLQELPWPREVLLSLGETTVAMRITLSYFIEPGPGEVGWKDRYRYPSCVLRFDVKNTNESRDAFISRINAAAEEDDENSTENNSSRWKIGTQGRDLGSIHSDIWEGTAAELAECNLIGIYPKTGWWKERDYLDRWRNKVRYSLVVSLSTPEQSIDLYTPIINKIKIPIPISITNK